MNMSRDCRNWNCGDCWDMACDCPCHDTNIKKCQCAPEAEELLK